MNNWSAALALILAGSLGAPMVATAQGTEEHHPERTAQTTQDPAEAQDMGMTDMRATCGKKSMMGGGMKGESMMGGGMKSMMGQGMKSMSPTALLRQKDELGLDESQIRQLEEIQERWSEAHETHMAGMQPSKTLLKEATSDEGLNIDRYESLLEDWADDYVRDHVLMARLSQEALQVLTEEQRSEARAGCGGMMGDDDADDARG